MSDTNTKTGNGSDGSSMMDFLNNNSLSHIMYNGPGGIPYAAIGMVTIAAGVFSYVTYADYKKEAEDEAAKEAEDEQSAGMFASVFGQDDKPSDGDAETDAINPDEDEEKKETGEETKEEEKETGEETKEEEPGEKFKLGGKRSTKKRKSARHRMRKTKTKRRHKK